MANEPFWMVYGDGQRAPTYKHDSEASAEVEARRLARLLPGTSFYVLETVARAIKPDVHFTRIERRERGGLSADDEIPF